MKSNSPYPGLRPFEREESDIFFGREEHVDEILEKLGQTRFIAVTGPSGCGKSSLVRTGLIAGLETGFLTSAGSRWKVAIMRPGNDPFYFLSKALLDKKAIGDEYYFFLSKDVNGSTSRNIESKIVNNDKLLLKQLVAGPYGIHELWQDIELKNNTRLLLIVDQFEEIFRYYEKCSADKARSFVELLLATCQHPDLYIILTMRSDYIGQCSIFPGLAEAINRGIYLTPRLSRDQLEEVITEPAAIFGAAYDPEVVNHLLNEIGNNPDQLPVLQHALMRMWNIACSKISNIDNINESKSAMSHDELIISWNHYNHIGGINNALSRHADESFYELNQDQQFIAEMMFRSLCERTSNNQDRRRPVKVAEIADLLGVEFNEVVNVANIFRKEGRSFITPTIDILLVSESILDITHESLIRQWKRLEEWSSKEKDLSETYTRLESNVLRWENEKASLLRSPELENAIAWRENVSQLKNWSKRYCKYYEKVIHYITESVKENTRINRNRKIILTSLFLTLLVICFLLINQKNYAQKMQEIENRQKDMALEIINDISYDIVQLKSIPKTMPVLCNIFEKNISRIENIYDLSTDSLVALRAKLDNFINIGNLWLKLGKTEKAFQAYESAKKTAKQINKNISNTTPENIPMFSNLGFIHYKLGDVLLQMGKTDKAFQEYNESKKYLLNLSQKNPQHPEIIKKLSISHLKMGDFQRKLNNPISALNEYEEAKKLRENFANVHQSMTLPKSFLSTIYNRIGDIKFQMDKIDDALEYYEKSLSICIELNKKKSNNHHQFLLSIIYIRIGDIQLRKNNTASALNYYERSMEIRKNLYQNEPDYSSNQRHLFVCFTKLGDAYLQMGKFKPAIAAYSESIKNRTKYTEHNPENVSAKYQLSYSLMKMGRLYEWMHRNKLSKDKNEEALKIAQKLSNQDKENKSIKNLIEEISGINYRLNGDKYLESHSINKALDSYNKSIELSKKVFKARSDNLDALNDIFLNYKKIGEVKNIQGKTKEAITLWQKAIELFPKTNNNKVNKIIQNEILFLEEKIQSLK